MPSALPHDDDDPVVASYDIYIANPPLKKDSSSTNLAAESRLFVLQYPSHRPLSKPYNATRSQKPKRLRLKPRTGMVEVEVPILTHENFNLHAGQKYGQSLAESRISQMGGSHGLAGGFASGPGPNQTITLHDVPMHEGEEDHLLATQTLGGKIVAPSERDPIYMLGFLQNKELHLTHLDAVVQMRPQLHHIDAEEEANQKKHQAQMGPSGKMKAGFEAPAKLESKAIELKMKDTKEDQKDRNPITNATSLRNIQADQWNNYDWIDEADQKSCDKRKAYTSLNAESHGIETSQSVRLQSMLSNDDWLDKMSIPREDGKKGLRAKLKGRDRERARRKKVEHQRKQTNADNMSTALRAYLSSDSDISSLGGQSDVELVNQSTGSALTELKEEPDSFAVASTSIVLDTTTTAAPRKRGRPKKTS